MLSSQRCLPYLLLVIIFLVSTIQGAPLPGRRSSSNRDGLIMGTDFLSLFIQQEQRASTSSSPVPDEMDTSTEITTTEVTVDVTQPHVQVSVRVSSSVSAATTASPDIFTTFLKAFSETAHSPSPSAAIRSSLTVEEPAFGTRINRRRQFTNRDSQSASEQVSVRFTPKTTPIPQPQELKSSEEDKSSNSDDSGQLYEKNENLQTEKIYAEKEKNFAVDLKYSDTVKAYAQPEKLYSKQEITEPLYSQQNNEVPESVTASQNSEGLQVFDKTLDAEQVAASQKFGYVVEGRNFRKYRVEERTPDGFIVGEYGVVSHDDGQLRGVRYTADSTINPKLIYDALMNFLKL